MREWFVMKAAEGEDTPVEIVIYDVIGKSFWDEDAVSAKSFLDALAALGDVNNIRLRVNSPGGDVFDSVAIHNAIRNHKAKVTAHVDGLAASGASFIVMAADRIVMPSNAFMLIHQASGFAFGTTEDMLALGADLERIDNSMAATYSSRSGQTMAKVRSLMKEDRLMDAKEAKQLGFTDEVTSPVKMTASYSLKLLPKAAADRFRTETGTAQGHPPHAAPVLEEPRTVVPSRSSAPPTTKVIDLDTGRKQGADEHRSYVTSVSDLCMLANAPQRIAAYVRANTPVDQVRKELLDMRATEVVLSQHQIAVEKSPTAAWGKITDKLNSRFKERS